MDFYSFYTGNEFEAYKYLGAHPDQTGVWFRTFAPSATSIAVIGEFNNWQPHYMNKIHDGNFFECHIEGAKVGEMYKYKIQGKNGQTIDHCDPYGFGMQLRPEHASIIRNLDDYKFSDSKWMKNRTDAKNKPLNIYEVHLGSFKANPDDEHGWYTYDKIAPLLIEHMKENGYNCIELMPVSEHPSDESWGYQNTGFFAPTSRYGTSSQLKEMVDLFHKNNMYVILDFVPVHFAVDAYGLANYDGTPLYEYPNDAVGVSEWGSCNFMHSRGEVRSFLNSAATYWLEEFHIDGLRMDAISRILYWQGDERRGVNGNAVDFVKTLNKGLKDRFQNCMLAAEDSTNFGNVTKPVSEGGLGFDYKWDMGWMNDTLDYMRTAPEYRSANYHKLTFSMMYYYDANFLLPLSHDENVHGKATILQKMSGDYDNKFPQGRLFYMYMMTHPGKKLNFMGNEIGQFREWDEKREQDWTILDFPKHEQFNQYIAKLNKLYLKNSALWEYDYTEDGFKWIDCHQEADCIYAYKRSSHDKELVIVLNFSDTSKQYSMPVNEFDSGTSFKPVLHTDWIEFGGNTKKSVASLKSDKSGLSLNLPAYSGILLEVVKAISK